MFEVDNKFEIGEECWSYYRKPTHYECPICKGKGKFIYNGYDIGCKNCNCTGKLHNPKQSVAEPCIVKIRSIKVSRNFEEVNSVKYVVNPIGEYLGVNVKNRGESNLFKTDEEAQEYCKAVNQKQITPEF